MKTNADRNPAEVYEAYFVPALFADWAERVADAALPTPGQRVLDVACGTGVLARAAQRRVGAGGSVVGLDASADMLAVAQRESPGIEWRHGRAEDLPFDDDSFDAVLSQFGIMFFEDRARALREMLRVLRPGGRMTVAALDRIGNSPGYWALAELLERLFGAAVANGMRAPYVLGDAEAFSALFRDAGIRDAQLATRQGEVRFDSIQAMIATERACVWTLGGMLDDAQFERLGRAAEAVLAPYAQADGRVRFPAPAHIVTAVKPR